MRLTSSTPWILALAMMASQIAFAQNRTTAIAGTAVVIVSNNCGSGETMFRAIRTTRVGGGIRVDYEVLETGNSRWANMNAALVRKYQIRVGAKFCMPQDTGDAADSLVDFD